MCLFGHTARDRHSFSALKKLGARARYYFSMETTAIIHRRYMPGIVMLTHWAKSFAHREA
jgi:hypothetical protein